ncbi:MAG: nucleotide exchange factor GrpE [Chloroflexota bacterium]
MIYNDLYKNTGRRRRIPVRHITNKVSPDPIYNQHRRRDLSQHENMYRSQHGNSIGRNNQNTVQFEEDITSPLNTTDKGLSDTHPNSSAKSRNEATNSDETDWKAIAQQGQADMDNFRRRQQKRADDIIQAERERLLKVFLPVADNLQRALQYEGQSDTTLREGVDLVLRQMLNTLQAEGVAPMDTVQQRFDPALHEAVALTDTLADTDTIVDEVETGYTLNNKLLRPAKVVVAK